MTSTNDSSGASSARPLFVAGVPRSGTSGFTAYLNRHPEILVCIERYKYLSAKRISPELFTLERILDFRERETNISRDRHVSLIERKDPARLRWVGDKYPHYVMEMKTLAKRNPGARFIVLHRPAEEVAESYEARASNPEDRWPAKNGFEVGIEHWNRSMRSTRRFVEGGLGDPKVLIVDYHRFFYEPESFLPVLSRFLQVDFDERVRASWASMSARFAERRRPKREITPEEQALVEERKDHAERGVGPALHRPPGQRPGAVGGLGPGSAAHRGGLPAAGSPEAGLAPPPGAETTWPGRRGSSGGGGSLRRRPS